MLRNLRIRDLILIENLDVSLNEGFHVLTGETGAGKSALIKGLTLLLGKRGDAAAVRQGADRAWIEGIFHSLPAVDALLEEKGIDLDDELIIRREMSANGKSRCFVNDTQVTLSFLKEIGHYLVKFVGQHANQALTVPETHREILDQYGDCDAARFSKVYRELTAMQNRLAYLRRNQENAMRECDLCREEIEEIESVSPVPGEDEELFAEYTLLNHSEEFQEHCHHIVDVLSGDGALLSQLTALKSSFEKVVEIDPEAAESLGAFKQTIVELQEVAYFLDKSRSEKEFPAGRLQEVDARLARLHKLKKKYGSSLEEVLQYAETRRRRLDELENSDFEIAALEKEISDKERECDRLGEHLSSQREASAKQLGEALEKELHTLNMPSAKIRVSVTRGPRSETGDDKVVIYLRPNVGEKEVPVTECASGGELSRLMLSLQVLLAGKEKVPMIVFDEIDANIGGSTAHMVGAKFKQIGAKQQVLCITHFPQVAKQADVHLQINKEEIDGRTITFVRKLKKEEKVDELLRMGGIKALVLC